MQKETKRHAKEKDHPKTRTRKYEKTHLVRVLPVIYALALPNFTTYRCYDETLVFILIFTATKSVGLLSRTVQSPNPVC